MADTKQTLSVGNKVNFVAKRVRHFSKGTILGQISTQFYLAQTIALDGGYPYNFVVHASWVELDQS